MNNNMVNTKANNYKNDGTVMHAGRKPTIVKYKFVTDSDKIYMVNNGRCTTEQKPMDMTELVDSGPNVGWLDADERDALGIRDKDVIRISEESFNKLKAGCIDWKLDLNGFTTIIEYDASIFTDEVLGVDMTYKSRLRDLMKNRYGKPNHAVPESVQAQAENVIGHRITTVDISLYMYLEGLLKGNIKYEAINLSYEEKKVLMELEQKGLLNVTIGLNGTKTYKFDDRFRIFLKMALDKYEEAGKGTAPIGNAPRNGVRQEGRVAKLVKHFFTMDTKNIYSIDQQGNITRKPKPDNREWLDVEVGDNTDWLDESGRWALCIMPEEKFVCRLEKEVFMEIRKSGKVEPTNMEGLIGIEYDSAIFRDGINGLTAGKAEPAKRMDGVSVASAAMNLSAQERERLGIVNTGVQSNHEQPKGQQRFGGDITISNIHRPNICPASKPVIQEGTSAWYCANVLKTRYQKYEDPIGVKSKVCIDKRFPMYMVPMIIDDMLGYAYLKDMQAKVVTDECIPVSTPVEGTYWMFHNIQNGKGITFYPDVLADVVTTYSSLFPEIDLAGKIRIAVTAFGNLFTDDAEDDKKNAIMNIYLNFFRSNPNFFHIMKVDWNTGFCIALSEESTPVLLMAAVLDEGYAEYPKSMTVIPISGSVGFAAVGLSASEVANIERAIGLNTGSLDFAQ